MKHFHAHIYYDPDQRDMAAGLRRELAALPVLIGSMHDVPIGPHPKGMFQIIFTDRNFSAVVIWLMQHRGTLDVLVHGESGDDLLDHTQHVMWLGNSLPLNLSLFHQPEQDASRARLT